MGNQILSHLLKPENHHRPVHFYASSGGNAGLAAVCAARSLGYPCTVVVPVSTKPLMVQKLRNAGAADVIQYGETFSEAGQYMKDVVMKNKSNNDEESADDVVKIALHPFDNEPIWQGNSTIVDELVEQIPPPVGEEEEEVHAGRALPVDAIVCSVGGGGLLNGLVMGIERHRAKAKMSSSAAAAADDDGASKPVHLVAVETKGTDSLATALESNELVSLPKITSQATSLGAIKVSERTFQYAVQPPPGVKVHSAVFSDAEAARGVLRLVDDERLLVELACGVCVEAAVGGPSCASSSSSKMVAAGQKRKRGMDAGYVSKDEGYGDDRLSAGENEDDGPVSSPLSSSGRLQSKLKELVPDLNEDSRVVIIVCGGSNVTIDMAAEWRKMLTEGWA